MSRSRKRTRKEAVKAVVEAAVEAAGHGGEGIARVDGRTCFLADALPGDRVQARIGPEKRGVLHGSVEAVLEPSPHRREPNCPVFDACGGCSWLNFAYPGQAEWKRRIVEDCLRRIGGLELETDWAEDPTLRLGYRTRATFHGDGRAWGFYARGSHDVVDIGACPLCHPRLNAAFERLRAIPMRGSVELTVDPEGEPVLAWTREDAAPVREVFGHVNGPGDEERASFVFDGLPIVNGAFSQSSLLLNRVLRRVVHDALGEPERLLDLYCGNGNFSLDVRANRVLGLDHNRAATAAAASLASGVPSHAYRAGGEEAFAEALAAESWDAVVLDPPRTGARAVMEPLSRVDAERLVYVSCDPATLARDAKTLAGAGWRLERAVCVDMFPQTPHVETVARFAR